MHNHNRWCWFKRVLPFPFPFAGAEPNIWQRQIKGCFACAARKSLSNLSASSQEHCFCSFWREHFLPFFPASCVEELLTDAEHKLSFPSEGSFADLLLTAGYHCSANSLVSHVCSGASRVQERSRCKEEGRARHFFFFKQMRLLHSGLSENSERALQCRIWLCTRSHLPPPSTNHTLSASTATCPLPTHIHPHTPTLVMTYQNTSNSDRKHTVLFIYSRRVPSVCHQRTGRRQRFPGARSLHRPGRWSGRPPGQDRRGRSPPGTRRVPPRAAGCRSRAGGLAATAAAWPRPPRDGADSRHRGREGGAHAPQATSAEWSRTGQDRTLFPPLSRSEAGVLPDRCPLLGSASASLSLVLSAASWASCTRRGNTADSLHSACCRPPRELTVCLTEIKQGKKWKKRGVGGEQRDSAEMFFFFFSFFKNNPVIWSLKVSLEISSIKALFCLPKEFFQLLAPPPPQGIHYLA